MYFLALSSTYNQVEIGLYQDHELRNSVLLDKTRASKELIPVLAHLIEASKLVLSDLSFIAVNQGPGPFTTLRVVISTANGLSFASGIPLIGVDGFDALLHPYQKYQEPVVALLNAFHYDVYYGIHTSPEKPLQKGYRSIDMLLRELGSDLSAPKINFIGNGTLLYADRIRAQLSDRAVIGDSLPEVPALFQIADQGFKLWNEGVRETQLMPLYLKQAFYTI